MQKLVQNRIPKEQKPIIKKIETPSLLTANKVRESLNNLQGWQSTDDHKMIYREFILQDFMGAIDLIDRIALIAEDDKHHPDIHLTQYRNLRIGLTTHDVGGLSEKDFIVAMKINDLPPIQPNRTDHKDRPVQKPRYEQKEGKVKQRKVISPVFKKEKNVKTNSISK